MHARLTLKDQHNRWMKKPMAAEARLRTVTTTYGIGRERVRAVQVACVQEVAMYGSELWWDPKEAGRRDDLYVLLNRQARSNPGALPTTPWGALMRESGLTTAPVIVDSREPQSAVRVADARSSKLKMLHWNPSCGAPICRVLGEEYEHGRTTEGMLWPAPGDESVVRPTILHDATSAKGTAQRWAKENEAKIGAVVWIRWTEGSRSDNGQV